MKITIITVFPKHTKIFFSLHLKVPKSNGSILSISMLELSKSSNRREKKGVVQIPIVYLDLPFTT